MAKWQISGLEARLKQGANNGNKPTTANVKEVFDDLFDNGADWEITLASGISHTFNCRVIVIGNKDRLHFFGSVNDLESVDFFFSKLRIEIDSWAEDAYPKGIRDRRSYAYGMTRRVCERMDELYKFVQEAMSNDCKDLVIVDKALVTQKVNEVYSRLGKMKHRTISNHDALARGYQDGANLNLASNKEKLH
jgi:hypothetical protein